MVPGSSLVKVAASMEAKLLKDLRVTHCSCLQTAFHKILHLHGTELWPYAHSSYSEDEVDMKGQNHSFFWEYLMAPQGAE